MDALRAQYPFSINLIPTSWPYFIVLEENVAEVQRMLESPEARVMGRDLEFQFSIDREMLQDGSMARFLYPVGTTWS
jgi:hypothetical protein